MAEQVNIASFSIDFDDVIKQSAIYKKQIDALKKSQKELKDSGEESTEAFVQNEVQIKKLSKSYRDNQQFATALDKANEDLTKTMKIEGKSTQQLRDDRAALNQISKNIIGDTEEEIELRDKLNGVINEQTEALKEQAPEYIEQKENIGAYTEGINAADFNLRSLIVNSKEAGGASNLVASGAKSAAKGLISMTKAAAAFILTPVGAVLAIIAGAFLLIKNAMNRSEDSTTKVKKAFAAFTGIVKGLLKFLEPLGTFLVDGLVKGFELVEKGVFKALGAIQRGLKFLGLDKAAESLGNFTEGIEDAVKASKELVEAELALVRSQRLARITQLKFLKEAELLRQIRDDESKNIQERIRANKELGRVLSKQLKEELGLAQAALIAANLKIKLDGETTEALDSQIEALTEIADIEERITGQQSEQLVNRVALQKEAAEKGIAIKKAELEAFIASTEESVAAATEEVKRKTEILDAELKAKLISQQEHAAGLISIQSELVENQAEIAKKASEDAIKLAKEQKEKEDERLAFEKERALIDAENKFAVLEAEGASEFELNQKWLDKNRAAELESAKKTGADKALVNKKFDAAEMKLQNDLTLYKQQQNQIIMAGVKSLFSESSIIGKAFAIAEIANNTAINAGKAFAQAAVFASNPLTLPLAVNANIQGGLIVALGAVQAGKTAGIKFKDGGLLDGRSHANGGIPFSIGGRLGFEAEGGEAIINKNSTSMFAPLLSAINVAGGGKKFASGGIAGSTVPSSSSLVDYDVLALKIAEANLSLPSPVVSVEEINNVNTNVKTVESLATA